MKTKLNPNARKWVRALRSGKFKQGRQKLCKVNPKGEERFCCLGVACELFLRAGGQIESQTQYGYRTYGGEDGVLPKSVQEWLSLASIDGGYSDKYGADLVSINDRGASFAQIADIIERNAETLFEAPTKCPSTPAQQQPAA